MKKIVLSLAVFLACVMAVPVHAQMMGAKPTAAGEAPLAPRADAVAPGAVNTAAVGSAPSTASAPAAKPPVDADAVAVGGIAAEEAEGKALWDKLQNKQIQCQNLTDDDFDVMGDFFMGAMIGTQNHEKMNGLMSERLGDAGETQMHIVMGKRLSGCDANAAYPTGSEYFTPMLGSHMGMMMRSAPAGEEGKKLDAGGAQQNPVVSDENSEGGYPTARTMHESIPFFAFGVLVGLAALAFFTLGGIYYWKEIEKQG